MQQKLLLSCGCSFTFGFPKDKIEKPYSDIVAEKINYIHKNLSVIGTSNYSIAKQIEYGLSFNPDLILIGATTPLRFDYIEDIDAIKHIVSFEDFRKDVVGKTPNKIETRSFTWFLENCLDKKRPRLERQRLHAIYNFLVANTNYFIKSDQDRLILLGSISKIISRNIKFLIVDFDNIFNLSDTNNLIQHDFRDLAKNFPIENDPIHFNQLGHNFLAKEILNILNLGC